ncbi:DNA primase [Marinitenerispora sediminis]|uniref:DNA primase n=1 Tax=Marinitenerispora sediminis TaxID=1931232 RepID=A0A368T257_9ACTN|nr:DNA primase [Marinitenerispora sediminis]RCV52087.1 DNA primase [Marinitenerispora sediminis]RCV54670.1 DNA primase [Marinitenerispora sediminis]RCV56258.1 DNA primase [Marinitenerispora sediminis]
MAGRIRDEDVALVRERSPIADVVGEYLQLRNAGGGSLKGLCPFHDEKSPSFNVTPSRGLFYCFGCSEGGDVIAFVQKIDHLSFVEAVESLAQRAGIRLQYEQGGYTQRTDQGQRQRLLDAHKAAAEFYVEQLLSPRAQEGRRFLSDRGFTRADAERFGVGFAPPGWESLTTHLRKKGFADKEIILAGLASQGRRGPYDKFRNRLVWPVREVTGEVVGFGARKLDPEDDGPKYLNTQETPIFKKSHLLYGLDLAKRDIARERQAVVVEGYTDVMACHLAGVTTAVATCGTSFGEEHLKILRRMLLGRSEFGGEVVFTFDGDAAGQKAALRAFAEEHGFVTETFVAVQPDGLDPCDLRLKHGEAAVRDLVAAKRPLYEFAIRSEIENHNLDTYEGRIAAFEAAAPIVAGIRNEGIRKFYGVSLDKWVGLMDESYVLRRVDELASGGRTARRGRPQPARTAGGPDTAGYDRRDPVVQRERQALKIALQHPALAAEFDRLDAEAFTVPQHRAVQELIRAQGGTAAADDPARWAARLRDAAPNDAQRGFVTELAVEPIEVYGELDEHFATEILGAITIHSIDRQIANLKSRLGRLDAVADAEEYQRVFGELMAVGQRKRVMRERVAGTA